MCRRGGRGEERHQRPIPPQCDGWYAPAEQTARATSSFRIRNNIALRYQVSQRVPLTPIAPQPRQSKEATEAMTNHGCGRLPPLKPQRFDSAGHLNFLNADEQGSAMHWFKKASGGSTQCKYSTEMGAKGGGSCTC